MRTATIKPDRNLFYAQVRDEHGGEVMGMMGAHDECVEFCKWAGAIVEEIPLDVSGQGDNCHISTEKSDNTSSTGLTSAIGRDKIDGTQHNGGERA